MPIEHNIERANRTNFRSCLEALSRPGKPQNIEPLFNSPLLGLASVFLYAEVSHHYDGTLDFEVIRALCGSPQRSAEMADYLFYESAEPEMLDKLKFGTPENPEDGATLTCQICDEKSPSTPVKMSGPGINGHLTTTLPLQVTFLQRLMEKNTHFPLGIDLFIISNGNMLIGIPRTTRIEVLQ